MRRGNRAVRHDLAWKNQISKFKFEEPFKTVFGNVFFNILKKNEEIYFASSDELRDSAFTYNEYLSKIHEQPHLNMILNFGTLFNHHMMFQEQMRLNPDTDTILHDEAWSELRALDLGVGDHPRFARPGEGGDTRIIYANTRTNEFSLEKPVDFNPGAIRDIITIQDLCNFYKLLELLKKNSIQKDTQRSATVMPGVQATAVEDALARGVTWDDLGKLKSAARNEGYNRIKWKREANAFNEPDPQAKK